MMYRNNVYKHLERIKRKTLSKDTKEFTQLQTGLK